MTVLKGFERGCLGCLDIDSFEGFCCGFLDSYSFELCFACLDSFDKFDSLGMGCPLCFYENFNSFEIGFSRCSDSFESFDGFKRLFLGVCNVLTVLIGSVMNVLRVLTVLTV